MVEQNNKHETGRDCPYMDSCQLILNYIDRLPSLIDRFKKHYCFERNQACSRRWILEFLGPEKLPELMMPQQQDWAKQLLIEAGIRSSELRDKFGDL